MTDTPEEQRQAIAELRAWTRIFELLAEAELEVRTTTETAALKTALRDLND